MTIIETVLDQIPRTNNNFKKDSSSSKKKKRFMSPAFGRVSVCNEDTNLMRKGGENWRVKLNRDKVKSRENSTILTLSSIVVHFSGYNREFGEVEK